jgi:hypothetical protein
MSWHSDTEGLLTAASPDNAERLSSEGRWPLTSNIAEAGGFFRTRSGLEAPDIQFHAFPANVLVEDEFSSATTPGVAFGPCLLKPTSRGKLSCAPGPRHERGDGAGATAKPKARSNDLKFSSSRSFVRSQLKATEPLSGIVTPGK